MIAERLPGRAALGKLGLGRGERKATLQQLIPVRIKTLALADESVKRNLGTIS